jgi:hypothetical protein
MRLRAGAKAKIKRAFARSRPDKKTKKTPNAKFANTLGAFDHMGGRAVARARPPSARPLETTRKLNFLQ